METDEDAIKLAFAIVNNTKPKDAPASGDKFWDDSSVMLISAIILYLLYEAPVYEQNFSTLMFMIANCQLSENDMEENPLETLFSRLEERDSDHPANLYSSPSNWVPPRRCNLSHLPSANLYMFNSRQFAETTQPGTTFLPSLVWKNAAIFASSRTMTPPSIFGHHSLYSAV